MTVKYLTLDGLIYYHKKLVDLIDKKLAEVNVIVLKECPTCGGHDFKMMDNAYECKFCGNKYYYKRIGDIVNLEEIDKDAE